MEYVRNLEDERGGIIITIGDSGDFDLGEDGGHRIAATDSDPRKARREWIQRIEHLMDEEPDAEKHTGDAALGDGRDGWVARLSHLLDESGAELSQRRERQRKRPFQRRLHLLRKEPTNV